MTFLLFFAVFAQTHFFAGGGSIIGNFYLTYKKNNHTDDQDRLLLKQSFLDKIKTAQISIVQDRLDVLNNIGVSDDREISEIMSFLITEDGQVTNDFLADPVIEKINKALVAEKYLGADATSLQTLLSMNATYDITKDKLPGVDDNAKQIKDIVKKRWWEFLKKTGQEVVGKRFKDFIDKYQPIFGKVNTQKGSIHKRGYAQPFNWPNISKDQATNVLGVSMGQAIEYFEYVYNHADSSLSFFIHAPTNTNGQFFAPISDIKQLNFSVDKIVDALTGRRDTNALKVKIVVIAPNDTGFTPKPEEIREKLLEKLNSDSFFNQALDSLVQKKQDQDVRAYTTTFGAELFAGCRHDLSDKYFVQGRLGLGYLMGDIKATQDHGSTDIQGRLGHFGYADIGMHRWINDMVAVGMTFGVNFSKLRLQDKENNQKDDAQYFWSPTTGIELTTRLGRKSSWFVTLHSGWHFGIDQKWSGQNAHIDTNDTLALSGLVTGIRFIYTIPATQ